MIESVGWVATAVVVASFFCRQPATLRQVQMVGAALWALYGFLIGAVPVIGANVLVFSAAGWTLRRRQPSTLGPPLPAVSEVASPPRR